MYQGKYVFTQVFEIVSRYEFNKCVSHYKGNHKVIRFKCWQQFLCMCFGQLTYRESIHDIFTCLMAHHKKAYHLGIRDLVNPTMLTCANEKRDWRIWQDFDLDLENTAYALDFSTIDLCLNTFHWAKFCKKKGAVKLHTLLDLRGNIPVFIDITNGKIHDVKVLDKITFEVGAFYIIDKGYYDFKRLKTIDSAKAFLSLGKTNLKYKRVYSSKVDKTTGFKFDQTIKSIGYQSSRVEFLLKTRLIYSSRDFKIISDLDFHFKRRKIA
jgi:hypothetical protein